MDDVNVVYVIVQIIIQEMHVIVQLVMPPVWPREMHQGFV